VLENRDDLPRGVRELIDSAAILPRDITAVALGIGPGSFTGLRVGAAFAKGFARGAGCAVWPVPSLQIFAANVQGQSDLICAVSHARKLHLHAATFHGKSLELTAAARVIPHDDLPRFVSSGLLVGPGTQSLAPDLHAQLRQHISDDPAVHRAHTVQLARLARELWEGKAPPALRDILPVYGLEFGQ
jgi:tRNA threonylcarbamoyladenosine biosynthesis protein TsaB